MKIVLLPFGLPVVVDRFLFLCSAIAEKGEVSRSDGGVENLSGSVFLNPLACGAPPIFPLWRTQGESLNVTPWHLQEAQKRKPYVTAYVTPLYFLAENTGGEVNFPLHHPHRNYSGLNFLIIILSCKFVKM